MGHFRRYRIPGWVLLLAVVALTGCQFQTISSVQLQIHQSRLDKNGLTPLHVDQDVRVTCAPPDQWDMLPCTKTLLYSHQQWRSPNRLVGMGVAHLHTPFLLSADMIIWFAKTQYTTGNPHHGTGGHLIGQWTDSLGRVWFEAENSLYHVKGYVVTHGFEAWIVYSGYRTNTHPSEVQILLAAKAADSVVPLIGDEH